MHEYIFILFDIQDRLQLNHCLGVFLKLFPCQDKHTSENDAFSIIEIHWHFTFMLKIKKTWLKS